MSTMVGQSAALPSKTFFGHPRGLAVLFATEMFERFSYYGMRALLILYTTAAVANGGLGIDTVAAGAIYGLFTGAAYLLCLPGGWVADRILGQRRSVFNGGILIAAGNFLLAVPSRSLFFLGLLVTAVGTGLLKPNVSAVVGELYKNDSGARRDAAFSIFYMGINLGAFLAPLVSGTIGETLGYRWGFASAGAAMLLGVWRYRASEHYLGDAGVEPATRDPEARQRAIHQLGVGALIVALVAAAMAGGVLPVSIVGLAESLGWGLVLIAAAFFGWVLIGGGLDATERKRVLVLIVFFICAAVFWAGFEQAGSTFNLFARDYTNRHWLGQFFAGGQHPVSWYQSVNSIFILLLSGVFAALWVALGRRDRDPSAPAKIGLGLLQLGISFVVMIVAAQMVIARQGPVGPEWLIFVYFLQTTGELCLSPIGLSNVTKLAPPRFAGQMMGTWFLGASAGNIAAGLIGGRIGASTAQAMPAAFAQMALIAGGAGLLVLLASPWLRRWMGGIR
jgi:proton-dependent oligopeptide transporter, POT family